MSGIHRSEVMSSTMATTAMMPMMRPARSDKWGCGPGLVTAASYGSVHELLERTQPEPGLGDYSSVCRGVVRAHVKGVQGIR